MVSPKPKSLDHEKRAWSSILEIVENRRAIDKQIIVDGGFFSFTFAVFNYCLNCYSLQHLVAIYSKIEHYSGKNFVKFVDGLNLANARCNKCGNIGISLGYAYFVGGFISDNTEKVRKEEIPHKYRSIANHPPMKIVYLTTIVTCIGKNKTIAEEVFQGLDKLKFRKLNHRKLNLENRLCRLYLPIGKINLNEHIQKLNYHWPPNKRLQSKMHSLKLERSSTPKRT